MDYGNVSSNGRQILTGDARIARNADRRGPSDSRNYFASKFQLTTQLRTQQIQAQQNVYAHIVGRRLIVQQLYVTYTQARIYSDCHEALWRLSGYQKDSIELEETQRWRRQAETLVIDIGKNNQALFEDVATRFAAE
jgi:hypothetical protein